MDAHRRFLRVRQAATIPRLPIDPLDPFGILKSKSLASVAATASASSASASVSVAASVTSDTASTSASASVSQSPSSASSSSTEIVPPTPSSTPLPTPTPDSNVPSTSVGPQQTQTIFHTVQASHAAASPTPSAPPEAVHATSFLENKVLSGIVFGVVGLIGLTLIIFAVTWFLRRKRNKRLVNEAINFDPVHFGKDDYPEDNEEKEYIAAGAAAAAGPGAAAAGAVGSSSFSNSGHDGRSMKSVGSYATGSASHGAPAVSQAAPFADYVPPVPYLNSSPTTPRGQHQFAEQQQHQQSFSNPNNNAYGAYRGSQIAYGQPQQQQQQQQPSYRNSQAPPTHEQWASVDNMTPYYAPPITLPMQAANGYDYGHPASAGEEQRRRSSSSAELKFASTGAGRK